MLFLSCACVSVESHEICSEHEEYGRCTSCTCSMFVKHIDVREYDVYETHCRVTLHPTSGSLMNDVAVNCRSSLKMSRHVELFYQQLIYDTGRRSTFIGR
jgi:hypothetical protein